MKFSLATALISVGSAVAAPAIANRATAPSPLNNVLTTVSGVKSTVEGELKSISTSRPQTVLNQCLADSP